MGIGVSVCVRIYMYDIHELSQNIYPTENWSRQLEYLSAFTAV